MVTGRDSSDYLGLLAAIFPYSADLLHAFSLILFSLIRPCCRRTYLASSPQHITESHLHTATRLVPFFQLLLSVLSNKRVIGCLRVQRKVFGDWLAAFFNNHILSRCSSSRIKVAHVYSAVSTHKHVNASWQEPIPPVSSVVEDLSVNNNQTAVCMSVCPLLAKCCLLTPVLLQLLLHHERLLQFDGWSGVGGVWRHRLPGLFGVKRFPQRADGVLRQRHTQLLHHQRWRESLHAVAGSAGVLPGDPAGETGLLQPRLGAGALRRCRLPGERILLWQELPGFPVGGALSPCRDNEFKVKI